MNFTHKTLLNLLNYLLQTKAYHEKECSKVKKFTKYKFVLCGNIVILNKTRSHSFSAKYLVLLVINRE